MKTYREVKCSDRLPDKIKGFEYSEIVNVNDKDHFPIGRSRYNYKDKQWTGHKYNLVYWLEELPPPQPVTDEKIVEMWENSLKNVDIQEDDGTYNGFVAGVKAISRLQPQTISEGLTAMEFFKEKYPRNTGAIDCEMLKFAEEYVAAITALQGKEQRGEEAKEFHQNKCNSCRKAMSNDCPRCAKLWES